MIGEDLQYELRIQVDICLKSSTASQCGNSATRVCYPRYPVSKKRGTCIETCVCYPRKPCYPVSEQRYIYSHMYM